MTQEKTIMDISQTVASICASQPDVIAAYVFGSVALGSHGSKSDIDVAVLLDEKSLQSFSILPFVSMLEKSLGRRVDVTVLNRADELLKYEVRRTGRLVFERSSEVRKRFEISGRKTFEDFLHLHKRYVNDVIYGR